MGNPTALITGASRGIGLELAKLFAAGGHDLILVARSRPALQQLATELRQQYAIHVQVLVRDLARPGAADSVYAAVTKRGSSVDILVNNAGSMTNADFADVPLEKHLEVVQLNIVATLSLTRLFLQPMLKRRQGRILNVASLAAFQPVPRLGVYAASKSFLLHLTEALSEELVGTGVTATTLCPGFTETDILQEAPDVGSLPRFIVGSARAVAQDGYQACMSGTPLCVSGPLNQMAAQLIRYQPRWMVRAIGGVVARRRRAAAQ